MAELIAASDPYLWNSDGTVVQIDFASWTGGVGGGDCMVASYKTERFQNQWIIVAVIEEANCQAKFATICEHTIESCKNPSNFDSNKMEFTPSKPNVGTTTSITCKPGYYLKGPPSSSSVQIQCIGHRADSNEADPSQYRTELWPSSIPSIQCEKVSCDFIPETLCHVKEGSIDPPNQRIFNYGQTVTVECENGFVYTHNASKTKAKIRCASVQGGWLQGIWHPSPCEACIPIRCNETELFAMVPKYGSLAGARSTLTEEEFGLSQQNMFNQFGNVVTVKCRDAHFYPDHAFEKFVFCGLKKNTTNQGEWRGYSGTTLPLPQECQPVTCQYEGAILKSHYNIEPYFDFTSINGTSVNTTRLLATRYPYQTKITYTCKEGYETIRKTRNQTIVCGPIGRWIPQLTGCLKKDNELPVSTTGRYSPPLVEAPSASQLGFVALIIIIIFLISLVLLDVATLSRDMGWLFNNIRLQKRLWNAKKRLPGENFKWLSDKTLVSMDLLPGIENSTQDGDVILAYYTAEHVNSQWTTVLAFEKSNGDEECSVLCEHSSKFSRSCFRVAILSGTVIELAFEPCPMPSGFDPMKTEFHPTKAYVGTTTTVGCKRGFYPNFFNFTRGAKFVCVGEREHPDEANPFNYKAYFGLLPDLPPLECEKVSCNFSAMTWCNVQEDSIKPPNQSRFEYGEKVTAECEKGFVYAFNKTSTTATMHCVTLHEAAIHGVWNPGPCQTCIRLEPNFRANQGSL
ncbi:unnamed protein product [Rodentolepis nana]|uniref:Sushi, von Willebrand factor type A, EGF and pentraxin domain-containing protein 1 n=1 Tax=Rodentolepis nana TaxID=102285 RepID=A0A158QIM3_RODNA|nr:unnamed protein product [Rodentolepis nana]